MFEVEILDLKVDFTELDGSQTDGFQVFVMLEVPSHKDKSAEGQGSTIGPNDDGPSTCGFEDVDKEEVEFEGDELSPVYWSALRKV